MGNTAILFWFVKIAVYRVLKRFTKVMTFVEVWPERAFVNLLKMNHCFQQVFLGDTQMLGYP